MLGMIETFGQRGNDQKCCDNNTDFYQSLFWHDIILLNDTKALNEFITTFCPYVEKNDLAKLAIKFRKRTIHDYHTFFGTNM